MFFEGREKYTRKIPFCIYAREFSSIAACSDLPDLDEITDFEINNHGFLDKCPYCKKSIKGHAYLKNAGLVCKGDYIVDDANNLIVYRGKEFKYFFKRYKNKTTKNTSKKYGTVVKI